MTDKKPLKGFMHSSNKFKHLFEFLPPVTLYKKNLVVFIGYIILTIILTYPVAFKMGTAIAGHGDAYQSVFSLWYARYATYHPEITSLSHNNMLFYPEGVPSNALWSGVNQIPAIFLIKFFSPTIVYNILWLLSFILGAYGTYLLVFYLTKDDRAAFISGIVFAFSPYHFSHALGHLGATTIQWIPFFALFLMKMFREKDTKDAIFAGIFFILVSLSDSQYMVFTGLFALTMFIYELSTVIINSKINLPDLIEFLKKYIVFGIVSFAGVLPLTYKEILVATSNSNFLKPDPSDAIMYSTDLLSFFLPSEMHTFFGDYVKQIYDNFTGNVSEYTTFIGYTVIILSILVWIRLRHREEPRFWLISAIVFSVISLGPILHVNGETVFTVFNVTIPLPHILLYYFVPFLENSRTIGRFFVIASLAFAVLAGYGLSEISKHYKSIKNFIFLVVFVLVIFEYLCIPFTVSTVETPAFYKEISADGTYALLEIPATLKYPAGIKVEYYQTIHQKPIVGGQVARTPSSARDFESNTPIIRELTFLRPFTADIVNKDIKQAGTSILNYYNISYIVLHKKYMNDKEINLAEELIKDTLNTERKTYEKDSLIVYRVKEEPVKPFIILKDNWYALEEWNETPTRWMSNNATLSVYSNEKVNKELSFQIYSHYNPRKIQIYTGDKYFEEAIPTDFTEIKIPLTLEKGENIIRFSTKEECFSPSQISDSKDTRELSFAIQNITIS